LLSKKLVSSDEETRNNLIGTGVGLKLIGSLSAIILISISSFIFINDTLIRLLIILYSLIFAFEPLNLIGVYFQSQVKSKINSIIKLYLLVISSTLKILLIIS